MKKQLLAVGLTLTLTACGTGAFNFVSGTSPMKHTHHRVASRVLDYASPYDFFTTITRLRTLLEQSPAKIFAEVPHSEGAASVGLKLGNSVVFIFGNPKAGTPVQQENIKIGLELPLRIQVWQDKDGQVYVTRQDFDELQRQYGVSDAALDPLRKAVDNFIQKTITK